MAVDVLLVADNVGNIYRKWLDNGQVDLVYTQTAGQPISGLLTPPSAPDLTIGHFQPPPSFDTPSIVLTTDGGETWSTPGTGFNVTGAGRPAWIAITEDGQTIFTAKRGTAADAGIYSSADYGASWSQIHSGDVPDVGSSNRISIWCRNGYVWWTNPPSNQINRCATTGSGFISTTVDMTGFPNFPYMTGGFVADTLANYDANIVFSGDVSGNIYASASGTPSVSNFTLATGGTSTIPYSITPLADGTLIALVEDGDGTTFTVYRSTNSGVSWASVYSAADPFGAGTAFYRIPQHYSDPADCWVILDYPKLAHSTTTGATWSAESVDGLTGDGSLFWGAITITRAARAIASRVWGQVIG